MNVLDNWKNKYKKQSENKDTKQGIITCSSRCGPKEKNDDYFLVNRTGGYNLLVICDGVSNSVYGGEGAIIATETFMDVITKSCSQNDIIKAFEIGYQQVAMQLKKAASKKLGKEMRVNSFQTTLISAVESDDYLYLTYIGDGQTWLIRGDLNSAIKLMLTHRIKDSLGGAITGNGLVATPVFLCHSKSFGFGEILIAGTDGAFDLNDSEKGTTMSKIIEKLKNPVNLKDEASLKKVIDSVLDNLDKEKKLDDNATLGIIMTNSARKFLMEKSQ